MKAIFLPVLAALLFLSLDASCEEVTWPFHDLSQRETALAGLRQKLFNDGIFLSLPKGISLYLDADEAPGEDGWIMVTVRQRNGEDRVAIPMSHRLSFIFTCANMMERLSGTMWWMTGDGPGMNF